MGLPASDSTVERLKRRALEAQRRVEAMRPTSRVVDTLVNAYRHDAAVGGGVLSAAIGFRIFLFMVPYVWVVITIFGLATQASGASASSAARRAGIEGVVAQAIATSSEQSRGATVLTFIVGVVALVTAAYGLLKVLWVVHGLAWNVVEKRTRTPFRVGVLILTVGAASVATTVVAWLHDASFIVGLAATLAFVIVPTTMWLLVVWTLPRSKDAPLWSMLPGALLFGVGVELLHVATVYWLPGQMDGKSELYGTIGTTLALLVWAYLLGRLIVLAAIVNVGFNAHVARRPVDFEGLSARLRELSWPRRRPQPPPQQ